MSDLRTRFLQHAGKECLFPNGTKCLLALSGGVDSMSLAQLLFDCGLPFAIAHCNFQLRGEESEGDESFIRSWAQERGIEAFFTRFDAKKASQKSGISTQMAARNLRYDWFGQIALQHGFGTVATAQHLNDSVETTLYNLLRGTGPKGLRGISHRQHYPGVEEGKLFLIRPLAFATRAEIEAYAHDSGISWREDSSNASDDYTRNFIRHRLVPLFEALNPSFTHTTARTQRRFRAWDANFEFLLKQYLNLDAEPVPRRLSKDLLRKFPDTAQALSEILRPYDFSEEEARQLAENLEERGFELASTRWRAVLDKDDLCLLEKGVIPEIPGLTIQENDLMVRIADQGQLFMMQATAPERYEGEKNQVYVSKSALQYPLSLRHWKAGDVFQPFGMKGQSQKLQDFFTNLKLSKLDKEKALILENGNGQIIWIVGYRLDERFRVTTGEVCVKMAYFKNGL